MSVLEPDTPGGARSDDPPGPKGKLRPVSGAGSLAPASGPGGPSRVVRFLQREAPWEAGEVALLPVAAAMRLIQAGVAEPAEEGGA